MLNIVQDQARRSTKPAPVTFGAALAVQMRCLRALMIRDMLMRYGRGNLGFLWVLVEPMLLTAGVMIIWSFMKKGGINGIDVIAFVLTGYVPLTLWRHLTGAGVFCIRSNKSLMYHRKLSALDVFTARMLLEFSGATAALVVITTIALTLDLIQPIQDWGHAVTGWLLMGIFAYSSALIICGLTEYSEVWERFIGPFQYLMLPLQGCFYMVHWLPTSVQEYALLLPSLHCYEAIRAGFFGDTMPTTFTWWYPLLWSLFLAAIGLPLLDHARDKLGND